MERRESKTRGTTRDKTKKLVVTGMLTAIMLMLMTTPLGYIPIGPTKATIMHLPVIIGAIVEGPIVGLVLGLVFGVTSMIQAVIAPTVISFVFLNPVVAILPRLAIGLVAYYTYKFSKSATLSAALATATNTVGVLGLIYLLYAAEFVAAQGGNVALAGKLIFGIAMTNGIPEMIVAAVVCGGVIQSVKRFLK